MYLTGQGRGRNVGDCHDIRPINFQCLARRYELIPGDTILIFLNSMLLQFPTRAIDVPAEYQVERYWRCAAHCTLFIPVRDAERVQRTSIHQLVITLFRAGSQGLAYSSIVQPVFGFVSHLIVLKSQPSKNHSRNFPFRVPAPSSQLSLCFKEALPDGKTADELYLRLPHCAGVDNALVAP